MSKIKLIFLAALAPSPWLHAAQPPTAGSQLRQIPPEPVRQKAAPQLEVKPAPAQTIPGAEGVRIAVKRLRITGASSFSEADLLSASGFSPGEATLGDLRLLAGRIADFYHRRGLFVAQAYLPAQDIQDGVVSIAVIEGQYGRVSLNNRSNVAEPLAAGLLAGLNSGDTIASAPLESRLLALSDLPGVQVRSTLIPGASAGASDLIVDLTPGQRVSGSVDADNAGSRYTGSSRLGATIALNEPLGQGDVATLRVLTSGSGLNYARGSYQLQFGKARVGAAYSHLRYSLQREFESLRANGTARIASVFGSYPLIRSRNASLYALGSYDVKSFRDRVDSTGSIADKRARGATVGLQGDHRDGFGGGGLNGYSVNVTAGDLDLRGAAARALDAASTRTDGRYTKAAFTINRLQSVTERFSLYGSVYGQFASRNLDVSEKMELGGLYAVRAYPEGEAYADRGFVATLEGRLLLPRLAEQMPGQLQLIGFVDGGSVRLNKNAFAAGRNRRTLSGAGIGVNWVDANRFALRTYYARKLGNDAATSAPDRSGRFWVQGAIYF